MIPIKLKKKKNFFVYIKMGEENIMFSENDDKSYAMFDLHISKWRINQIVNNNKQKFLTQQSLIVYVNHVLLGFYFY